MEAEQTDLKQEYAQFEAVNKRTLQTHHRREQVRRVLGMIENNQGSVCSKIKQIEVLSSDGEEAPK